MMSNAPSIDNEAVARFSAQAAAWWDIEGPFRLLHRLNPLRVGYIRDRVCATFNRNPVEQRPLHGLRLLDVGCGGGLLAEPLTLLGADVTGLDASQEVIAIAQRHAKASGLKIDYRLGDVETLAKSKERFDVITALEIIEHVADRKSFLESLAHLLKPGGMLIFSTLNRTRASFLFGIVAAEYLLAWMPPGTHDWEKFLQPSELARLVAAQSIDAMDITGMVFHPLTGRFSLSKSNLRINYFLTGIKKE
jgi:2-polyprenyl-6-hydroxyphenyl methylase/3-demethylubiquinone-9 3-methyltransferase